MTNDTTKMHNTMKMHFYKIFLKFCEKTVKIIVSYLINLKTENLGWFILLTVRFLRGGEAMQTYLSLMNI